MKMIDNITLFKFKHLFVKAPAEYKVSCQQKDSNRL
jgi:hypothetical protein